MQQATRIDLEATLVELQLQHFLPRLLQLGVTSLSDVAHLLVADFEEVGLTRLQTRKLQQAALSAIGGTVDGTPVAGPAPRLSVSSPPGAGPQVVAWPASNPEHRAPIIRSPPTILHTQVLTSGDEPRKVAQTPNGSFVGAATVASMAPKVVSSSTFRAPMATPQASCREVCAAEVPHLGAMSVMTAVAPKVTDRVIRSVRGSYVSSPPVPAPVAQGLVLTEPSFPPADPAIDAVLDASADRGVRHKRLDASAKAGVIRRQSCEDENYFFDASEDVSTGTAPGQRSERPQPCIVRTACPNRGGPSTAASTSAPSSSDRSVGGRNARPSQGQPATSNESYESESGSDFYEEEMGSDEQTSFDARDPRTYFRLNISLEENPTLAPSPGVGQRMPDALRRRLEHRNEQRAANAKRGQQQAAQKAPMSARSATQQQQENNGVRLRPGEEEPTSPSVPAWMNLERQSPEPEKPTSKSTQVPPGAKTPQSSVRSPRKGHGGPAAGKQQRLRPAPEGVGPLNLPVRGAATPTTDAHRTASAGAKAGTSMPHARNDGDRTPPPVPGRLTRSDSGTQLPAAAAGRPRSETPRLGVTEVSEGGRQMFDKNTLRAMHRDLFKAAVQNYRQDVLHLPSDAPDEEIGTPPTVSQSSRAPVTVYARIRPLFPKDEQVGDFDVATVVPARGEQLPSKMMLHNCLFEADLKTPYINHMQFEFDHVFGPTASNRHVYSVSAKHLVEGACNGGVGTLFMFGQTGSGKTHTMTAIEEMAAIDIFAALPEATSADEDPQVAVQFVELRGNRCYDLIARDSKAFPELRLRETAGGVYSAEGAVELFPRSHEDLTVVMRTAHSRRATSATSANDVSSRSHAVCAIQLLRSGGQLLLVDCAGTERKKDSMHHTKERQQEGAEINASLHALKECIRHMSLNQRVPSHAYRASALTKILADTFSHAGQAKLVAICTASPCVSDTEHTLTTLRMGMALGGRGAEHEERDLLRELVKEQRVPRVAHPKQWNPEQVRSWLSELQGGQFKDALEALPSNTTGQMLIRLTVTRCSQLCRGSARRGQLLFELLHQEIQRAEESRNTR
mmetsp:Transcript_27479/g.63533  ORF Transcript_27479/g.63533 Transcript_27479/m.63533 type:complete len:1076 (-) Transcript_27479:81-3308(-)